MSDKIAEFRALHVPGDPLILVNIWDAGSAKAVAAKSRNQDTEANLASADLGGQGTILLVEDEDADVLDRAADDLAARHGLDRAEVVGRQLGDDVGLSAEARPLLLVPTRRDIGVGRALEQAVGDRDPVGQ